MFYKPYLKNGGGRKIDLLFSLLAGFSAMFLGGSVILKAEIPAGKAGKAVLAATAGIAVFIFYGQELD